jgi:hypothetical protein
MYGNMSSTNPTRTEESVSLITERVGRFLHRTISRGTQDTSTALRFCWTTLDYILTKSSNSGYSVYEGSHTSPARFAYEMRTHQPSTSFTGYTSVVASDHIWQISSADLYRSEMQSRLIRWCLPLTYWWDVLPSSMSFQTFSALQGRSSPSITATRHCPAADTASVLQRPTRLVGEAYLLSRRPPG